MRLLVAFLMAVGMVMLSSLVPEPALASGCGYENCYDISGEGGEGQTCEWVSTPCPTQPSHPDYSHEGCGNAHCPEAPNAGDGHVA